METHHTIPIVLISAFFAILFLQSGIDKVVDWKGNSEYLAKLFANSPLKKCVVPMLSLLTTMEIGCGFVSLSAILFYFKNGNVMIAYYAAVFASLNFLCLFFGLRLSKDYGGAAGLVPYFIVSLLGIYFAS